MSSNRSSGREPRNQSSRRESRREPRSSGGDGASRDDGSAYIGPERLITADPVLRESFVQRINSRSGYWDITANRPNVASQYSPAERQDSRAGSSRSRRSRSPRSRRSRSPRSRRSRSPRRRETRRCAHCQREGHYSRECVGPVVPMGYLSGTCVECEETGHVYGPRCPKWEETKDKAAMKLIWFRQNKPEVQSDANLADLLKERLDAGDEHWLGARNFFLPWTGLFAWNYQKEQEAIQGPGHWTGYRYSFVGRPDLEAPRRPSDPKRGLCADTREAIQKLRDTGYAADEARMDVDVPRSSTRRAASSVTAGRSRTRSSISVYDAQPDECTNCDQPGHSGLLCPLPCSACGSAEHKYWYCPKRLDACICRAHPRHLLEHCQVACELCGDDVPAHPAVECEVICQYCGQEGHSALHQCWPTICSFNRICRFCKAGRHLVQHCDAAWCPDAECNHRIGCKKHCTTCGYPEELDLQREEHGGPAHSCQWRKVGDPEKPGSGVYLQCPGCGHKIASSGDIGHVRLSAVARYTSKAKDWEIAKAKGREAGGDPWDDELPECPRCFKKLYEDGDYDLQRTRVVDIKKEFLD
ncbi:hypothetical protein DL765_004174 [Monosporascus sp. GIB2]|nr:hypothetical protein DL765_004174 [Monosporascus sp. GIB2]